GEFHYWRLPDKSRWESILKKYRAGGFNCVRIYFHWGYHSPDNGIYKSDTSVKNCLKRLRLTDNSSYLKRKSSGRKPLVNKRYERLIIRKVKSNPSMRRMTKRSLAAEFQSPPIAPSTL
ncbi:12834_t:CDS:2, partial [Ambispora leptoticha]